MRSFFEIVIGVCVMFWYLIFNKEEARQLDYDRGCGEIEDEC